MLVMLSERVYDVQSRMAKFAVTIVFLFTMANVLVSADSDGVVWDDMVLKPRAKGIALFTISCL